MYSRKKRGLLASAGALVTAAALALGGSVAAYAAPTIPPAGATGSLNITKYTQPDAQQPAANGLPKTIPSGSKPIEGVEFTIRQVQGIDLSTNAGWEAAAAMTVADATAAAGSTAYTATTDEDGRARFGVNTEDAGWNSVTNGLGGANTLPIGLYLVQETGYTQALPDGPASITKGAPFLVTVPLTNPSDNANWMYNIYLYPKNSTGNEKTVTEGGIVPGSNVQWTIKGDIQQSTNITKYVVTDVLDARLTTADNGSGIAVSITNATGITALDLERDTDYEVAVDDTNDGANDGKTKVTVTFLAPGFAKLVLAWQGNGTTVAGANNRQVQVVINSTVNTLVVPDPFELANGVINNEATIEPNENISIDTNEVTTKWGALNFNKVSSNIGNPALPGTQFKIVGIDPASVEAGSIGNPWLSANTLNATGDASVATDTFTADANGRVIISGLRYSNFADGVAQNPFNDGTGECATPEVGPASDTCVVNPKYQAYWLIETKAHADHELLAQPVKFIITDPSTQLPGGANLVNVPKNAGFELPLTGGMGTALLTILGVGILAAVLVVARRRQNADAAAE